MKFSKVIGDFSDKVVGDAEELLSRVITELGLKPGNTLGSGLGGDPLVFTLVFPMEHWCVDKIGDSPLTTAATDGKRFYWNPHFINGFMKDVAGKECKEAQNGLRFVAQHEAWHDIFMHPDRAGRRHRYLWNICVDYRVNFMVLEDINARKKDGPQMFKQYLGDFVTLDEYAKYLEDPFNPPPRLAKWKPTLNKPATSKGEAKELRDPANRKDAMFFADPKLPDKMDNPEKIYDFLLSKVPKCPECGKLGMYKFPKSQVDKELGKNQGKQQQQKQDQGKQDQSKSKQDKSKQNAKGQQDQDQDQGQGQQDQNGQHSHGDGNQECDCGHDHGQNPGQGQGESQQGQGQGQGQGDGNGQGQQGQRNDQCDHGCGTCGGGKGQQQGDGQLGGDGNYYYDPFGFGDLIDVHMDAESTQEEAAKRLADAIETAKRMAGTIPGGLEGELGELLAPKLTWQDFIRIRLRKARDGHTRPDWTKPKVRPLMAGIYLPKRMDYHAKIFCSYDCSGSMSDSDIAYGISQLAALDGKAEMNLTPFDTQAYWSETVNLKRCKQEDLKKTKVMGRGGTAANDILNNYEKELGFHDICIIISDGYLSDNELNDVKWNPKTDYVWLITSDCQFQAPHGRVFKLNQE